MTAPSPAAPRLAETCGLEGRGPRPRWRAVGGGAGILRNAKPRRRRGPGPRASLPARLRAARCRRGGEGGRALREFAGIRRAPAWRRVALAPPRRRRELPGGVRGGGDVRARCPRTQAALARGWRRSGHSSQRATPPKAGLGGAGVPARTFARGAISAGRRGGGCCGNLRGSAGLRHGGELRWRRRAEGADFLAAFVAAETCGQDARAPRPRWRAVDVGAGILRNAQPRRRRGPGPRASLPARLRAARCRRGGEGGGRCRNLRGSAGLRCCGELRWRRSWRRRRAAWKAAVPGRAGARLASAPAFFATRNPAEGGARDRGLPGRTSPRGAMPGGGRRGRPGVAGICGAPRGSGAVASCVGGVRGGGDVRAGCPRSRAALARGWRRRRHSAQRETAPKAGPGTAAFQAARFRAARCRRGGEGAGRCGNLRGSAGLRHGGELRWRPGGVRGGGDVRAGCPRSRAALARGWRRRRHSAQRETAPKAGLGGAGVPACTFARGAMPAGRGGEGGVRCGNLRGSAGLRHGGELCRRPSGVRGGGDVRARCPRSQAALARGWRRRRHSAQRATPPKAGPGTAAFQAARRRAARCRRGGEKGVGRCGNLRGSAGLRRGGELRWRRRAEGADFLGARASRPHVSTAAGGAQ